MEKDTNNNGINDIYVLFGQACVVGYKCSKRRHGSKKY